MKVWLLTYEVNDYDQSQCGEYFEEIFAEKPTIDQLELYMIRTNQEPQYRTQEYLQHILNGGGRIKDEYCWFHLKEHETYAWNI